MTLFGRDTERLQAGDVIDPCPKCGHLVPAFSLTLLCNSVTRRGRRRVVVSGERLSCQNCTHVYSVGPNGVFEAHPNAMPYLGPQVIHTVPPPNVDKSKPPDNAVPEAPDFPMPKGRP